MQTLLTNMKKSEGYISIETIIIAGLIISLGAFLISKFAVSGQNLSSKSISRVDSLQNEYEEMLKFNDTTVTE